ncbi:MAG: 16S rRNA (cytosine(1402)-N(4))-methyltransferase RsmH [Parachlamydiaceae bacterium]
MSYPHLSVLAEEVLHYFSKCHCRYVVDGTLGAGGHAEMLLKAHPEIELFVGIDQDPTALAVAQERLAPWKDKILLLRGNFNLLEKHLNTAGLHQMDAILLDLGVSSMQLDQAEKGFSFMREGPLDMRMDPDAPLSARDVVNTFSEKELGRIFREYGEEKQWRAAARRILEARAAQEITTTMELSEVLMPLLGWKKSKGKNPMTLIFQALRIFVNHELDVLKEVLPVVIERLAPAGRAAVITFHSLEDRCVKEVFRSAASDMQDTEGLGCGLFLDQEPLVKLVTRKPVLPTKEEMERNSRSRSAKLRVIEKL